jgi:hypothetical protein
VLDPSEDLAGLVRELESVIESSLATCKPNESKQGKDPIDEALRMSTHKLFKPNHRVAGIRQRVVFEERFEARQERVNHAEVRLDSDRLGSHEYLFGQSQRFSKLALPRGTSCLVRRHQYEVDDLTASCGPLENMASVLNAVHQQVGPRQIGPKPSTGHAEVGTAFSVSQRSIARLDPFGPKPEDGERHELEDVNGDEILEKRVTITINLGAHALEPNDCCLAAADEAQTKRVHQHPLCGFHRSFHGEQVKALCG